MRSRTFIWSSALSLLFTGCRPNIEKVIESYEYRYLVPPSQLVAPGTIVKVVKANPLVLERVCSQKAALGDITPSRADTVALSLAEKLKNNTALSGDYLDFVRAKTSASVAHSVHLSLTNVQVYELTRDQIEDHLSQQSEGCRSAIDKALSAHEPLTMIMSVIQADASYVIEHETGLTVDATADKQLLGGLGLTVGSTTTIEGKSTIESKNLYWGVRELTSVVAAGLKRPDIRGKLLGPQDYIKQDLPRGRMILVKDAAADAAE